MLIENKSKFVRVHASSGHKHAVEEILSQPAVQSRLADTKASEEIRALATFFDMLKKDPDRAYYGYNVRERHIRGREGGRKSKSDAVVWRWDNDSGNWSLLLCISCGATVADVHVLPCVRDCMASSVPMSSTNHRSTSAGRTKSWRWTACWSRTASSEAGVMHVCAVPHATTRRVPVVLHLPGIVCSPRKPSLVI